MIDSDIENAENADNEAEEEENKDNKNDDDENDNDVDNEITNTKHPSKSTLIFENKNLSNEVIQHQNELKQLMKTDPEFYQHLKQNDLNLLNFGENENENENENEK